MSRPTAFAAFIGAFVVLVLGGGLFALDRAVLHWYSSDSDTGVPEEQTLGGAEAEAIAIDYVRTGATAWLEAGWWPFCNAEETTSSGWVVQCGMRELRGDGEVQQLFNCVVSDDGRVTRLRSVVNPEERHVEPEATATVVVTSADRTVCSAIRGTAYRSETERDWYQSNCVAQSPLPQDAPLEPE